MICINIFVSLLCHFGNILQKYFFQNPNFQKQWKLLNQCWWYISKIHYKLADVIYSTLLSLKLKKCLFLGQWTIGNRWLWIQHFELNYGIFSILNYSAPIDLWYSYLYDINNSQKMFVLLIYFGKRYDLNLILFAVNEVPIRGIAFIL